MKRFMMTLALTCVLSASALAGDVPTVGITAPPPDETTPTSTLTAPGEVPSVGYAQEISEAALDLFQMLLGTVV